MSIVKLQENEAMLETIEGGGAEYLEYLGQGGRQIWQSAAHLIDILLSWPVHGQNPRHVI